MLNVYVTVVRLYAYNNRDLDSLHLLTIDLINLCKVLIVNNLMHS